ncbi:hypothetical protein TanjilG_00933 [Lupinus angustifolius]|uniref:Uncharacterized protein n=1 Tax=Lupinus angustifolius TaxID=3871 RepID=A0A4P1QQW8_LUPAN|nr:PREDICTED: SNF2 domain-containing protein CLASSY 4-like isoform X2 [Lupinus angustifolius]OIV92799.1 hypothetical protein TanjilG_00933 [Lupinus angustifolius]
MHCVSARTRSKRALNDNLLLKQSTKINNNPVSDFEVVGLSSDDDDDNADEECETIVDFVEDEEEFIESSDFDFNAMENEHDDVLVVSDFEKEDDEVKIAMEAKRGRPKGKKGENDVGGIRRRKIYGLDILIDENNSEEKKCAAQRTRSHFCSNNKKKNKLKLGTIAQPICIDDDDDDENEEENEGDFDDITLEEETNVSVSDDEEVSGSESDEQYSSGSKRKGHACVNNNGKKHKEQGFHILEILKDSIYGKEKVVLKARDEEPNPCTHLPIKFSILHEGPKEAEKSEEEEEELEPIWAEMERGLYDTPDSCVSDHMRESSALPNRKHISSKFTFLHKDPKEKENSEDGKELEPIWAEMERGCLDDTPKSCVTDHKREASALPKKKQVSSASSFLHKDLKATRKSEEENGLEPIWAEMECGLNDTPDSWVSGHKREASVCSRKKHVRGDPKDIAVLNKNVLQDYIYGEGEVLTEEPIKNELNPINDLLPVFPFMCVEPTPPEKSDEEKELDVLWAQLDLALYSAQENSTPVSQVQNDIDSGDDQCPNGEVSKATLCRQGKHHLRLNEEIGLVCIYCLHVGLDIKDHLPPFSENPFGKSNRRDFYFEDHAHHSVFNDFQDRVTGYDDDNICDYTGTVWTMIPGVKKNMYPHQCEAFEFLWKNLAGGIFLDQLKEQEDFHGGGGCIISHAPGTGKTRLTITFLQTYMKLYPKCRSVIIAPKGMLLTWEEEFRKWNVDIPFHNLNSPDYSGKESKVAMNLATDSDCNVSSRLVKLYSWKCTKSILGISYKLFEQLTRQDCRDKELRKFLLEHPGLLVLDEGHTPRNSRSLIWKAVSQFRTKKRIILSGTPFQNNFKELRNTLCLARPKFADWNPSGGKGIFNEKLGHPRKEYVGKWKNLTKSFGKVTDDRKLKIAKEVRNMIRSFVHVHKGTILQESLPGMKEFVVILKPTQLQKELIEDIQRKRNRLCHGNQAPLNVMKIEYEESVTAVHPALFDSSEGKGKFERLKLNPEESSKTNFLMELIRLSELVNEKVLVFCQFISPLKLMASQLKHHFSWTEGREVLHMHGQVDAKLRQASIKSFNNPNSNVRVMLASTKACYEGISLVGASRVVLLDVVWNPSVERQAISRAYRLGQKKYVYTYHLITAGTMEEEKRSRQAEKDQLSELMFFNSDGAKHPEKKSSSEFDDQILEEMVQQEKFRHVFEKVAIKKQTLF